MGSHSHMRTLLGLLVICACSAQPHDGRTNVPQSRGAGASTDVSQRSAAREGVAADSAPVAERDPMIEALTSDNPGSPPQTKTVKDYIKENADADD